MKINNNTVKAARQFSVSYLTERLGSEYCYHNLAHTVSVVKAVELLCDELMLPKDLEYAIVLAAWFHDLGYATCEANHETIGAGMAEEFLKERNIDKEDIEIVKDCIGATSYPQHPRGLAQEIICDADMFHLTEKKYLEAVDPLRKEWEYTRNLVFTNAEWIKSNIQFLSDHSYHTPYGREEMEKRKQKNLKKLIALNNELNEEVLASDKGKNKKKKEKEPGRGVETFFRIASTNHMRLSGMADNKAHILLSINSIIISVILSVLAKKLIEGSFLIFPTAILLAVCLTTIVFAVLTTRPKITKGVFTAQQITNQEANLLFFGNFHQMAWETYQWGVKEMMIDKNYLYTSMTKDIYFLGKVLAVKYRYLNIGYKIFMYGLIVSVIAFGAAFYYAKGL